MFSTTARYSRLVGLVLALSAVCSIQARGQRYPLTGFDAYVTRSLAQWRVPGVAIAVVRGDSVVLVRGYGYKEAGRQDRVTARTMFEIGSTTKAFSSAPRPPERQRAGHSLAELRQRGLGGIGDFERVGDGAVAPVPPERGPLRRP